MQLQQEPTLAKRIFWKLVKTAVKRIPLVGPSYELVDETVLKSMAENYPTQVNRFVELIYARFEGIMKELTIKCQTEDALERELQIQPIQKEMDQFCQDIQSKRNGLESLLHAIITATAMDRTPIQFFLQGVEQLSKTLNLNVSNLIPSILHRILQKGQLADLYEILEKIPDLGSQEALYRAVRKEDKDRIPIVMKVLKPNKMNDPTAVQKFLLEGFLCLPLEHSNIVRVYDYGGFWKAQEYFIEMEDVDSVTLQQWAEEHPYDGRNLEEYLSLILQGISGIQYIHEKNFIHRGIKPSNFIVHGDMVKLVSLGTMQYSDSWKYTVQNWYLTVPKELIGTIEYMSPEQFDQSLGKITYMTDVYSLGISLYKLFTKRLPFEADSVLAYGKAHTETIPIQPCEYQPKIPAWLSHLILQMLEKRPENRPTLATVQECLSQRQSLDMKCSTQASATTLASLEDEQVICKKHIEEMRRLAQSGDFKHALVYYETTFPAQYKTDATKVMRNEIWNALHQAELDLIQELAQKKQYSQAWQLLYDLASTPTSPEYQKLAAEIALAYVNNEWSQGRYKEAMELCDNSQRISPDGQALSKAKAKIQGYWQDLHSVLQEMQQAIQSMDSRVSCSESQVNSLLKICQRLQIKKGKEKAEILELNIPRFSKKPKSSPNIQEMPGLLESVLKPTTRLEKTPAIVAMLGKNASIGMILEKSPSLVPYIEKASSLGLSFLGMARYSCGGVSHEMLEFFHEKTSMKFVLIPGGSFLMGTSPDEADRREDEVQHEVTLSPYFISKTLVTQIVWQKIMNSNPSYFKGDDRPVECVSWDECMEFCKKVGLSLPTEAQWEHACRAGTQSAYCFGNDIADLGTYAWYDGNSDKQTHPVGQKKSNAFGLYDFHGNVWEWVLDWYKDYPKSRVIDPTGPSSGSRRVSRGGSWSSSSYCRSAVRGSGVPSNRLDRLGFRVVV